MTQNRSEAEIQVGDRVVYSSFNQEEYGKVSSINEKYVFVRFDEHVNKLGWDGATSQACNRSDLKKLLGEENV